jgi:subtilisin-like proprotein convertase family protein
VGRIRGLLVGAGFVATALGLLPAAAAAEAPPDAPFVITGSRSTQNIGLVRIWADRNDDDDYEELAGEFAPYTKTVTDAVRVAAGDLDGDGRDELITAAGNNVGVKIFELGGDGRPAALVESIPGFADGNFVAAGDLNGDGRDELIIGADDGGPPTVRIYTDHDDDGLVRDRLSDEFQAYPVANEGGVRVAAGNTNNLGGDELITAPGTDPGLRVRIRTDTDADAAVSDQPLVEQFFAYNDLYDDGVFVASGPGENVGNSGADVFLSAGGVSKPTVVRSDADGDGKVSDDPAADAVPASYGGAFTGGVRVAAGDTDNSGTFVELLAAPGAGAGVRPVKIYDDDGPLGSAYSGGTLEQALEAWPDTTTAGAYVAVAKLPTETFAAEGLPTAIPENSTLAKDLIVPARAGVVRDLDTFLGIAHTFNADLDVTLTHVPSGISVPLFSDVGGTDEGFIIELNDEAGTDIGTVDNPADGVDTGIFNPEGAALLSAFDGLDASGRWRLSVTDDTAAGADVGTLFAWNLTFTY